MALLVQLYLSDSTCLTLLLLYGHICMRVSSCQGPSKYATVFATLEEHIELDKSSEASRVRQQVALAKLIDNHASECTIDALIDK